MEPPLPFAPTNPCPNAPMVPAMGAWPLAKAAETIDAAKKTKRINFHLILSAPE